MGLKIPKVMIAAVKSGSGKTTVTCAFLKQLLCRKKHPVSFKCGPDYIDPMFHEQVLKIPSKNLDTFFSDASQIQALYEMELPGHDIAVLEGVMGLYDGLGGIREEGSSYHLAKTLDVPVILVVDAHGPVQCIRPADGAGSGTLRHQGGVTRGPWPASDSPQEVAQSHCAAR